MRPRKTDLKKMISKRKRKKVLAESRLTQSIGDMLEDVTNGLYTFDDLLNNTDTIAILNRAKINNFLNMYISKCMADLADIEELNNKLADRIKKKKDICPPGDLTRFYLKSRELQLDELKILSEFAKAQEVKLDLPEQNMVIIYRSLPPTLQKLMYNTIMEFVRKCPTIQRELEKQKENAQVNPQ